MDDTVPQEDPPPAFNKIDLSQLQGFSFGTQWTQDKSAGTEKAARRPEREARHPGPGDGGDRRDRRAFRRPEGPASARPVQPDGESSRRSPGDGLQARPAANRDARLPRRAPGYVERTPYESPIFAVTFHPDDATFEALAKTIRASCRTIELFEIARTILAKPERFVVQIARKVPGASEDAASAGSAAQAQPPVYISVPDGFAFETEEAAISHVIGSHLGLFFDRAEAEIEPPKGNFQVVNRCGVTGELLGPPNYHLYNQAMQQHHAAKLARMPFDVYRSRIESVRDPELIKQWLEKMKRVTRYVWKKPAAPEKPVAPEKAAAPENPAEPAAEGEKGQEAAQVSFDSLEEARTYLLAQAKDRVVRAAPIARIAGRDAGSMPPGEVLQAGEGALERQRRFPLETANALRGRLRREHFTIFKKGTKGISYVCAVKRKFRIPGQAFSENIGSILSYIEEHAMIRAGDLARGLLKLEGPLEGLSVEEREKAARVHGDLLWLVREGYVTEFMDGGLYAPPPLPEARKREVEREENDPENFPEAVPAAPAAEEPAMEAPPEPVLDEAAPGPASVEPTVPAPAPGEAV